VVGQGARDINETYRNPSDGGKTPANGWPIASGAVDGACNNLIEDRIERSQMRWTEIMAEAVVKLRAIHLSTAIRNYGDVFSIATQTAPWRSWLGMGCRFRAATAREWSY
jgi:hypothetical protein